LLNGSPLGGALPPWLVKPHRLISLWEIMERVEISPALDAVHQTARLSHNLRKIAESEADAAMRETLRRAAVSACNLCSDSAFVCAGAQAAKLLAAIDKPGLTCGDAAALIEELKSRLIDEMKGVAFIYLDPKEAKYYDKPREGWGAVEGRFPKVTDDIEEASKCYALGRYVACIYHALQVTEIGLLELGVFIGVRDPKSGFTAVFSALDAIIEKKHGDRTEFEQRNFPFLEQVHAAVGPMKNAWRNKISHAQARPLLLSGIYTAEIAEDILLSTRAFMRRLAMGLPS
jgi:hypothetical protein